MSCFPYYYGPYVYSSAARLDMLKVYNVRQLGILAEPISLDLAWKHLRIETQGSPPSSDDDEWLAEVGIPGARDWCEQYLGRSIAQQTLEVSAQGFPSETFSLPFGPVLSVTGVGYTDVDGIDQLVTSTDYELDSFATPSLIRLIYGATWPTARDIANSVTVQYVTGYSLVGDSPQTNPLPYGIKVAMLLVLGHLYENRENSIVSSNINAQLLPEGAASFLERYRLRLSMA